jgi:hypothetical protein
MSVESSDPRWLTRLIRDYQSGVANAFLVHGSVDDYVDQPGRDEPVREYLAGRLAKNFSVVLFSPDEGITFPGEQSRLEEVRANATEARARFEVVTGLAPAKLDEAERFLADAGEGGYGGADLPREPERAIPKLIEFLAAANGDPPVYARKLDRDGNPTDEDDTDRQIGGGDGSGKRAVVIVDRMDLIVPPCDKGTAQGPRLALLGLLGRVGRMRELNALGAMLVLLAPSLEEVHVDLRAASTGLSTIAVPPADLDARLAYLERSLARPRRGVQVALDGLTPRDMAISMAGLGLRHIEDVVLRAVRRDDQPGLIDRTLVRDRKRELVASEYGGILEVVEPTVDLADVGGHEAVKQWLDDWIVTPARSGDAEMLAAMAQGILLSGPSGTGKTMVARGLAKVLGWNFVFIRPENVKSQWVGESEKLWAKAMRGTEAMAPAVVFFDEIDQKVQRGGRGGGGGEAVENNMFGRLLEWMTEPTSQGRLLFVGATNEPQNVDPALKRPGRLGDGKLPLLAPETPEERVSVLQAALRSRGVFAGAPGEPPSAPLLAIGKQTEGWTQAELGALAKMAKALSKIKNVMIDKALSMAVERMRPATADLKRMTLLALIEASDMTLVPTRWRPLVEQMQQAEEAQATAPRRAAASQEPREGRDLAV